MGLDIHFTAVLGSTGRIHNPSGVRSQAYHAALLYQKVVVFPGTPGPGDRVYQ